MVACCCALAQLLDASPRKGRCGGSSPPAAAPTSSPSWSASGTFVIDPVELVELDPLEPQVPQAELALLAQVLRPRRPGASAPGPCRVRPALVAITRSVRVGVQRLLDQQLGHERSVRVGRVDQVDAELDRPAAGPGWPRSGSFGSPQTPGPVSCIAPKPSRLTESSPPIEKVPDADTSVVTGIVS